MDFFIELLESFSRKHDRKLKLLEAKNDPIDPARVQAASKLLSDNNLGTQSNEITVEGFIGGVQKPLVVRFSPKTGSLKVHNTYVSWDPNSRQIVSNDQKNLKKAVTHLIGKDTEKSEDNLTDEEKEKQELEASYQKTVGEGVAPGITISNGKFQSEEAREDAVRALQSMVAYAEGAFTNIGLDVGKYKSHFFGGRIESLERRISESSKFLAYNDEFKGYVFEDGELIDDQIVGITETLENMMKSLATETCPEGEQSFTKNIAKTSRGEIVISPHADASLNEALVFTDDRGLLKDAMTAAFKKCGFSDGIPQINILSEETGGNSDNNTLGTGFELFQKLAILVNRSAEIRKAGGELPSDVAAELSLVATNLQKKMKGLSATARAAFIVQKTAGLSPEDSALVNDLKDLLTDTDEDGISLYKKMLEFSVAIVRDRNPGYITEAGQETKFGQRQDIREYYSTPEEARDALARSGLNPDNFRMLTIDELEERGYITDRDAKAMLALKVAPNKKTPIAVAKTSMKAYKSLKRVTWGKGSENTYLEMMEEGLDGDNYSDLTNTMLDDFGVAKENRQAEWDRMRRYHKRTIADVHNAVNAVPLDAKVTVAGGKKIGVKAGIALADAISDSLSNNSTYGELTEGDVKEINKLASRIVKEKSGQYTKEAVYARLQKEVATYITHKQLQKDLNSSKASTKQNALRSILSKAYHAGGSDDSKLNETAFGWAEARTHVLSRNDVFRDIARGKKGWGVDFDGSDFGKGIIHFSSGSAKVFLNTTAKATRTKKDKRGNINNEATLIVNEEASDMYDKREKKNLNASTEILKALSKLHEVLASIEKKVSVINA
jgi:hypothetical protein